MPSPPGSGRLGGHADRQTGVSPELPGLLPQAGRRRTTRRRRRSRRWRAACTTWLPRVPSCSRPLRTLTRRPPSAWPGNALRTPGCDGATRQLGRAHRAGAGALRVERPAMNCSRRRAARAGAHALRGAKLCVADPSVENAKKDRLLQEHARCNGYSLGARLAGTERRFDASLAGSRILHVRLAGREWHFTCQTAGVWAHPGACRDDETLAGGGIGYKSLSRAKCSWLLALLK
jgi:hypothetical protein